MASRTQFGLLTAALTFLMIGLWSRDWVLISLPLPLIVFLLFSTLRSGPEIGLEVERSIDFSRVQAGEEVEVSLSIRNVGEAVGLLEVVDELPLGTEIVAGTNKFPVSLDSEEEVEIEYKLRFEDRGKYTIGPMKVVWREDLLTHFNEKQVEVLDTITVTPRIARIKKNVLTPEEVTMPIGNVNSRFLGRGMEFYSLRDYLPGDTRSDINWKASARMGELITNEHESERSGDVTIIVDARYGSYRSRDQIEDKMVEAAASISWSVLWDRHRVGMMVIGEYMQSVSPGYGRRQFYRIVDSLITMEGARDRSMADVVRAMDRFFSLESMIVVIIPLSSRDILESVIFLRRRGNQVVVISPSTIETEAGRLSQTEWLSIAKDIARLKRRNLIIELGQYCTVMNWEHGMPLESCLSEVKRWRRRGTGR